MEVSKFDNLVQEVRTSFREELETSGSVENVIFGGISRCCSKFEEDALIENLKEEFEDYCKEVQAL